MNSAYLYVRVSTDEQKRKGYSLPEQEDRLLRHCEQNNIEVKGIFPRGLFGQEFLPARMAKAFNHTQKPEKERPGKRLVY